MIDSPHNHLATPEQQRPYTERSAEWLRRARQRWARLNRAEFVERPKRSTRRIDDHQNMMDQLGHQSRCDPVQIRRIRTRSTKQLPTVQGQRCPMC